MSVTTSVGDLHKAPFQSCSVRRAREDDRASKGELTETKDTNGDRVMDILVGKNERE